MTYEEALKILRYEIEEEGHCSYIEEEMKLAMNALEKQIPQKPLPYKGFDGKCVCCGVIFLDPNTNYCGNCGQALDWSDK